MINFKNTKIYKKPFPIYEVNNFFDDSELEKIITAFPHYNEFIKFKKTMGNRRFLSNDNPDFFNFINKKKIWKKFYNLINTQVFFLNILKNFKKISNNKQINKFEKLKYNTKLYKKNYLNFVLSYISREFTQLLPRNKFLNFFRQKIKDILFKKKENSQELFLRFDISSAFNGYSRESHRDSDGTIIAFLIYLEDYKNIGGSGGEFIIHDKNQRVIKKIKPKKNKAIFFLSNENSFHSVSRIIKAKSWRKFLYGGYTANNKNIWK